MVSLYPLSMVCVAILTIRSDALERFRAFETTAAQVMTRYGGVAE